VVVGRKVVLDKLNKAASVASHLLVLFAFLWSNNGDVLWLIFLALFMVWGLWAYDVWMLKDEQVKYPLPLRVTPRVANCLWVIFFDAWDKWDPLIVYNLTI
jgi:hypothetical protein